MSRSSVEVSAATRDLLKKKKAELGVKSMEDAILHLLGEPPSDEEGGADVVVHRKRARVVGKEEEEDKVPQLLSYEILAREPKALKWFTGMKEEALNWTVAALKEAVTICCGFRAFSRLAMSEDICAELLP